MEIESRTPSEENERDAQVEKYFYELGWPRGVCLIKGANGQGGVEERDGCRFALGFNSIHCKSMPLFIPISG